MTMTRDDYDEARLQERRDEQTPGTPEHAILAQEARDELHAERMLRQADEQLLEAERLDRIHHARMSRGETDPRGEFFTWRR